jgi:O-antigen/teichoic acid export membrane protein
MSTASARGAQGGADRQQASEVVANLDARPQEAASRALRLTEGVGDAQRYVGAENADGYPLVNPYDDTLESTVSFVLGPAAIGGHQDRQSVGSYVSAAVKPGGTGSSPGEVDSGAAVGQGLDSEADTSRGALTVKPAQPASGLLRRALGRLGWGVADQAVSSITNAAISIYAARSLPAAEFGAFSLAYVTYALALNASRGLATDPLMVRFSGTGRSTWRRAVAGSTATALVVGVAAGICVLVAAVLMSGTARLAFLALGLTLPGLMLQDSWRYSFFALGRGSQAFVIDTIWAVAMLPGMALIRETHRQSVFWFVLCWGAGACVAAAVGPLQAQVLPCLSQVRAWVSRHRDLGPRYLAENTANSGASQLRSYGLGVIAGLAPVGYVQAASTLMGPFMVIFMGMSLVTVPEAARVLRRAPRRLPLFCVLVAAGLMLAALSWGAILLIALPRGFGQWLLGPIWRPAYPVVLPTVLGLTGATCIAGASAGLRAMGASRRSLRTQVITSAAYVVMGLVGAAEGGAVGAVGYTAVAIWVGAGLWWWQLRKALRESARVPDGHGLWASRPAGRHRTPARAENRRLPPEAEVVDPGAVTHPTGK